MKSLLLVALLTLGFFSCKGGGNGNGTASLSHNQLASRFVNNLNLDQDFNVSLVKSSTNQSNYIVIYDPHTQSYDAINIASYDPNSNNASTYYYNNSYRAYNNLWLDGGHYESYDTWDYLYTDSYGDEVYGYETHTRWVPAQYIHWGTGITFEKSAATKKDLAKVSALVEEIELDKTAQFLSSDKFGLSLERAKNVARLALNWKKASKKGMTDAEHDNFSTELLGFSITAAKAATKKSIEGDSVDLKKLIKDAAKANDITPEHANGLMTQIFGL